MRRCALPILVALAVTPGVALAQPRYTLETTASVGYGFMQAGRFDRGPETSGSNGGLAAGLLVALRSPYYLTPWLELGYAKLYGSSLAYTDAAGMRHTATAGMRTLAVVFGPAVDFWRLRVGLGIGIYNLGVSSTVDGVSQSVGELDMGYSFMVSGRILTRGRFRLGVQVRGLLIIEAEINTLSVLLDLGFDALRW
ncbi:MAG: hypothetical protein HY909_20875 [Deltaproteobacteria bacterium]|nr:hypothetical protein [Deltaproteobacteria bacterium]